MIASEARLIYFSPAHASEQVAEVVVYGTGIKNVVSMNFTLQTVEEAVIPTSALTVIVMPVYGGYVVPLAMKRMESIRGLDTPAVLTVTYGNRAYEKALIELDALAIPHGLKMIAGVTFTDEHSYSTNKCPIADGHPNESDLDYAEDFGRKVMEKIQAADGPGTLYQVDVHAIKRPSQPFFPLFHFSKKVIELCRSGTPPLHTPWTEDEGLCTHCGICAARRSAGAIAKGDELNMDAEKCIKCCACMKACVNKARKYDTPFASLPSECFKKQKLSQTIL